MDSSSLQSESETCATTTLTLCGSCDSGWNEVHNVTRSQGLSFRGTPAWKKILDLVGSLLGLVILSPLFLLIAVLIRLGSPGPVFYRQLRYGAQGRPFWIWKFRTMLTSVNQSSHLRYVRAQSRSNGSLKKLDQCAELIPGGGLLRMLSIDELPQLFNVVRGEMSLVGPRPDVIEPSEYEAWQLRRFEVLPGMTGLWQVSGKNSTTFVEMIELDAFYAVNRSVWLDARILCKTPWIILRQLVASTK